MSQVLPVAVPCKLGWSNGDCGPDSMRLYALDAGDSPRWAEPHARVPEQVLREAGAHEGSRWTLTEVSTGAIPRRFVLRRDTDHTGISGTGNVAEGIQFSDGQVAMRWVGSSSASTGVWDSLDHVLAVHGHDGATVVVWLDA